MDRIISTAGIAIITVLLTFVLYLMLVILPVAMYNDSECLEKGYPKGHVTYKLDRYCSNLDGSVTVKVVKSH